MADLTFDTFKELSPSDFGAPIVAKKEDGSFRSFGVNYQGTIIWNNNADWYKAWNDGVVMPKSIIIKEEQLLTKEMDDQNMPVKVNGRQQYVAVEGKKTLVLVSLKTKTQLANEDDIVAWNATRSIAIQQKVLDEHNKYTAAAMKAADGVVITEEKKVELDKIMAKYGL